MRIRGLANYPRSSVILQKKRESLDFGDSLGCIGKCELPFHDFSHGFSLRQGHLEDIDAAGQVGDVDARGVLEYSDLLSGERVHFHAFCLHAAEIQLAGGRVGIDGEVVEVEVIDTGRCKYLICGIVVSVLV